MIGSIFRLVVAFERKKEGLEEKVSLRPRWGADGVRIVARGVCL